LFLPARRLQELRPQTRKLSGVRVPVKNLGLEIIVIICSVIINDTHRMIRFMISFRAIKIDKECKHLSNLIAVTLLALCYRL
jgi:hypothetical protein